MANYNYGGGGYPGPGYPGPQGAPGYNPPQPGAPGYNPPGGIRYNPPPGGPGYNPPPGGPGYNPPPGAPGYNPSGVPGAPGYNPSAVPGAPGYNPSAVPGFNPGGQGVNPPPGQYGPQQGYGGQPGSFDQNIVQWFHAVDRDRTGKITANELQMALTNSNWSKFNMDTCKLMINMFDRDKSGQIDLNEFQALWAYIHQWKGIFDQFDGDRSGSIDGNELHNAYIQMGYRLSPQFAQSVVSRFDMNGQRKISLDYFIHSCVLIKSVTDQFRVKDAANTGMIQVGYEDFLSAVVLNRI